MIGNHRPVYDAKGLLLPWTSWTDALSREMNWYLKCPAENGYRRFVVMTVICGDYESVTSRRDMVPAMQNGVGIIACLKCYAWTGKKEPRFLDIARSMGDYLVKGSLTPDTERYPPFTRSNEYKALAYQALNDAMYAINEDGCPQENALEAGRGGRQEDSHTDKIHNFIDAVTAYPEWAK